MKTDVGFSLNLRGRLVAFERAAVMAIINATPDSFYAGARNADGEAVARALDEGADMLDLGAYSSRSGAAEVMIEEEWRRLSGALREVRRRSTAVPVSVDTFRAEIARRALDEGADIINDISGGMLDKGMDSVVAEAGAPYVVMHMRGTPATMQQLTDYEAEGGVTAAVERFMGRRIAELSAIGVKDIIFDPGFGFAKSAEQNYELLRNLPLLREASGGRPLMVGVSRKSMLYKPLGLTPEEVLPATCAAHVAALQGGASILRVHDTAAARQIVDLWPRFQNG